MEHVILTDEQGADLGIADIMIAHTGKGKLHKAFSIFVFSNDRTKLVIQQRSEKKMLFPLYWANTCCSHPRESEDLVITAEARLLEECGFSVKLTKASSFIYRAEDLDHGVEHEYDTVLTGIVNEDVEFKPNPDEVADLQWIGLDALKDEMKKEPEKYAPWFEQALQIALGS
jgi:isopentenyl-diphosphate delta-isomerase type 1